MQDAEDKLTLRRVVDYQADNPKNLALSVIKKNEGEAVSIAILVKAIQSVSNYFNVGKNVNAEQILDIAKLTAKHYFMLTENQIELLVDRIKLGKYSEAVKILDSFDGRIWFQYLSIYQEELTKERKQFNYERLQQEYEAWAKAKALDPPTLETMKRVREVLKEIEINKLKPEKVEIGEQTQEEIDEQKRLYDKYLVEFFYLTESRSAGGVLFKRYGEYWLSQQEYIKKRFSETNQNHDETN